MSIKETFYKFANDTMVVPTTMLVGIMILMFSIAMDSKIVMAISIPFVLIGIPKNIELRRKTQ